MTTKPVVSDLTVKWLLGVLAGVLLYKTAQFAGFFIEPGKPLFVDFNAFHIAGEMSLSGEAGKTYYAAELVKRQELVAPGNALMPWTYPPPFNLVCALLAMLPVTLAYFLFASGTLAAYLVVLRRLAGEDLPIVLAATFPVMLIALASGQNGFLTSALLGLACHYLMVGRAEAGLPLGLMVIKPHLALPLGLAILLDRRWDVVAVAGATAIILCLAATFAFGAEVWGAFLHATSEARLFLSEGMYRLYRMVSAYALVRSLGAPASVAFAAQAIIALALLAMVAEAAWRSSPVRHVMGLAVIASPFISPYAYDYDLCILGIGLALLMPGLKRAMTEREQLALLALFIAGGTASLIQQSRAAMLEATDPQAIVGLLSLGGIPLLAAVAMIWRALRRNEMVCAPGKAASAG